MNKPHHALSHSFGALNESVTVPFTAPSGFQISADNFAFTHFSPLGGKLAAKSVWIPVDPNANVDSCSGDVTLSSTGTEAATRALRVSYRLIDFAG